MTNQQMISQKAAQHLRAAQSAGDALLRQAHQIAAEQYQRQLGSGGREPPRDDPETEKARANARACAEVILTGLH